MDKSRLLLELQKEGYSKQIISAFEKVNRESFLPEHLKAYAYENMPLPIGKGSTISQPSTIAFMFQLLNIKENSKVLEIGSGSGYVLSLISNITKSDIYGIEINEKVAAESRKIIKENPKIHVINRNGFNGMPDKAPFNRILVSASCNQSPRHLFSQLAEEGILVVPVENSIFKITNIKGSFQEEEYPGFSFVQMQKEE